MQLLSEMEHSLQAEREHAGPFFGYAGELAMLQWLCLPRQHISTWLSCAAISMVTLCTTMYTRAINKSSLNSRQMGAWMSQRFRQTAC